MRLSSRDQFSSGKSRLESRSRGNNVPNSALYDKERNMDIKVLGPGCAKCQQTEKIVKEAVVEAAITASVEKVTDVMKIAEYGVFGTPSVVVDGEVKSVGKIPTKEDVKKWISK
jgi:small redox-active disulfide protein 2